MGATFSRKTLKCSLWYEETESLCTFEYHDSIVYLKNFKQVAGRLQVTRMVLELQKKLKC